MKVRLLTVEETADRLAVSVPKVRKMLTAGELPVVRIGRSVRVRETDVDALVGDFDDYLESMVKSGDPNVRERAWALQQTRREASRVEKAAKDDATDWALFEYVTRRYADSPDPQMRERAQATLQRILDGAK